MFTSIPPGSYPKKELGKVMLQVVEEKTKFKPENLSLIIQLADTDGIYIDEKYFIVDKAKDFPQDKRYFCCPDTQKVYFVSEKAKNEIKET